MKKIMKKVVSVVFCTVAAIQLLTGCGAKKALVGEETTQTAAGETGQKKSGKAEGETIHLKIATCVAAPKNMDKIVEQANAVLKEKLNVTIEVVQL